ncbi:MAG: DUF3179 domain-containing (seleno)protein [Acidimicrobiia bacterium]|nr:DUF3179 domain-containing (seleno)protein [Acidimicrobiia bacterium]
MASFIGVNRGIALVVILLVATACSGGPTAEDPSSTATSVSSAAPDPGLVNSDGDEIPPAPSAPTGPLDDETVAVVERVWASLSDAVEVEDIAAFGTTGDVRLAWLLADVQRFLRSSAAWRATVDAFNALAGTEVAPRLADSPWREMNDYLIAWDTPAPPGYSGYKERLFTLLEPGWQPFFADTAADIDWRLVSWGGVFIDNRPLGTLEGCPRGCIPALDDPPVTPAEQGSWYPDDAVVFGVTVNGESRAYPKNIMEVHEMVNDTLGDRRIGMPYCTLCGSAQAFYTDVVPDGIDTLVLRTSGLLSRSNKVMYDLGTGSMFDTFLGVAVTGPLREVGYELEPIAVVTSTWGEWKAEHPDTTIVARGGGRGIDYPADPLRGRDDDGPIFPVGDVDPRLPVQEAVLGAIAPDGTPIAFPITALQAALDSGGEVSFNGVIVTRDGGGFRASTADGNDLASHQAFWFAWSQFYTDTIVWSR